MGRYIIFLSDESKSDIDNLSDAIMYDYQAPVTAFNYVQRLLDTIFSLSNSPKSFPIQTSAFFLRYGTNVHRINYKKMAIIYTVHGDAVYIHRILPANLITSL